MQLRSSLTFSNIFLSALVVLLTWTSLAQGAAINRDIAPVRRDLGEARASGVEVSIDDFLRRDGVIFARKPEGAILVERDGADGLAARTAEENNEQAVVDGHGDLPRRWYTLIEIEESQESD